MVETARSLSQAGEQPISLSGAKELTVLVCDGPGVTAVERRSFDYVVNNFTFSRDAQSWLDEHGPLPRQSYLLRTISNVLRAAKLNSLEVQAFPNDIGQMNCRFPGSISFAEALTRAINDIQSRMDRDTPRYELGIILENLYEVTPSDFTNPEAYDRVLSLFLHERMERGRLRLLPIYEEIPETEQLPPAPDNREASSDYWIFYLEIETDDHQFWTVVHRQSGATATYGLN